MRLIYNKTSKGKYYYIIRSVYLNGKNTSRVYEKLGYLEDIQKKYKCEDPEKWIQDHLNEINEAEKEKQNIEVLVPLNPNKRIPLDVLQSYKIGYLFLQKIYYELHLDIICKNITKQHDLQYNLNSILSRLVYARILDPSSELSAYETAKKYLEPPEFEYNQAERALSVLSEESDYIQAELYKYSSKILPRNTGVLYYNFTDFLFETEQEGSITNHEADKKDRKCAASKKQQSSPPVQTGLFMDYSGIPLAMHLSRENRNEQQTLTPLEERIIQDSESSVFVICTYADLSGEVNSKFNNSGEHSFVSAVSIKTMEKDLQKWCLDPDGWHLEGSSHAYNLNVLDGTDNKKYYDKIFYKETTIKEYVEEIDTEFNQTLVVTFSFKYKNYMRNKRIEQIYIRCSQDEDRTAAEEQFDGFYAVKTNLADAIHNILRINRTRWEIQESFRIFKKDFFAVPSDADKNDLLKAHFLICFIALLVYRILENKLGADHFTSCEILSTLKELKLKKQTDIGFSPDYTRTALTDALHEVSGFNTDLEIIRTKALKGILAKSKKR